MLSVTSEIGRLRTVMVHLPGAEIDRMVPSMMNDLLFDDILFGERAREEHRRFQKLLEYVADEVLEVQELLVEVLADDDARGKVLDDLRTKLRLEDGAWKLLVSAEPGQLAEYLIAGIIRPGLRQVPEDPHDLFLLAPLPNLCFQRDPAAVIGRRVAIASMATEARLREPLLLSYVFRYHPRFREAGFLFHRFDADMKAHRRPSFEGGDILVAREDILLVGVSARTGRHTLEQFAEALKHTDSSIAKLIIVDLPKARSFMHLDTVFTLISQNECLIHEPAVLPGEVEELDVYQIDLHSREVSYTAKRSLLEALASNRIDLRPIPCGGPDDPIAQQREQWTDGANAFALAPGIILCYKRNVRTAEQLSLCGYEIVNDDDLLLGRVELDLDSGRKKYAIQLASHELSRARGGPRCMTMPLRRDASMH